MKHFRSILSVVFAFLVLLSSSSFIVGVHLCGGRVWDTTWFNHAEDCGMEKFMPQGHLHNGKSCCENEEIVHNGDDFRTSVTGVSIPQIPVVDLELPHVLLSEIIPAVQLTTVKFYNYDPPLPKTDLTVSLQVFLI